MAEVMFCQNSQSITDSRYSAPMRSVVGFDGWRAANSPERLAKALDTLYWYRKQVSNKTRVLLGKHSGNFQTLKSCVEQTLHTVNGVLCKKFLLFPCEMEGYTKLSELTAQLFESIVEDYLRPPGWKIPSPDNSIFLRMKMVMKAVKRSFCSENKEVRWECFQLLEGTIRHCKFAKFFAPAVARLKARAQSFETDYTESIAWVNTMSGMSQTRNLGYLPEWIALVKRAEFRDNIGRTEIDVDRNKLLLIRKVVQERQREMGIEPRFLSLHGRKTQKDFGEVINNIKLPLKPTASVRSTVFQGGKVEDARQLLNCAMMNRWRIPIRDLSNSTIDDWIQFSPDMAKEAPEHEGFLFWTALQILVNWFARKYKKYEKLLLELPGSEEWEAELWKMSIVHISEPGKERNLTKTSSVVAWVLTIASKVSQMVLAFNQDHRAGLILSAQDWMHQRRVSSDAYESFWMYDRATRKRMPNVWNGFQDWKESTDFIPRQVGAVALAAWFEYIDFPRWYSDLTLLVVRRSYDVTEYTHTDWVGGEVIRHYYAGRVSEGFMMSMPLTKTILHLMHDVNIGTLHCLLDNLGIVVAPHPKEVQYDPVKGQSGQYMIRAHNVDEMR